MRSRGATDFQLPDFVRTSRWTLIPVVNALGDVGLPLFVLKGKQIPYLQVILEGNTVVDLYSS